MLIDVMLFHTASPPQHAFTHDQQTQHHMGPSRAGLKSVQALIRHKVSFNCHRFNCDIDPWVCASGVFVAAGSVPVCVACLQEECKGWDVSSIVFSPALWLTYQSIMRADFKLFDQYEYTPQGILHPVSLSLTEAHPAVEMRHIKLCDGLLSVGCRLPLCTQRLKCERGCCMLVCRRAFCIPCQHVSRD